MRSTDILDALVKILESLLREGGYGAFVLALSDVVLLYLYLVERKRNKDLTDLIVEMVTDQADKYVKVVSASADSDKDLAKGIETLAVAVKDLEVKVDSQQNLLILNRRGTNRTSPGGT